MRIRVQKTEVGVPAAATELVEATVAGEDEERDLDVAEDGELPSLLDESAPTLGEGHLPAALVLDSLHLQLPPPHYRRSTAAAALLPLAPLRLSLSLSPPLPTKSVISDSRGPLPPLSSCLNQELRREAGAVKEETDRQVERWGERENASGRDNIWFRLAPLKRSGE